MKISVKTIQISVNYMEHTPRMLNNPLIVERIGYIQNKTEPVDRRFVLPSFQLVLEGRGFLEENGKRSELIAPFMLWNWPGDCRKYWPAPVWDELYVGFQEGAQADLLTYFAPEFFRERLRPILRPAECLHYITELRKLMAAPALPGAADRIDHLVFLLMLEIIFPQQTEHMGRNDHIAQDIAQYLQANFKHDVDLNEVAELHGWSYSTFQRQWLLKYGCSPLRYLRKLRNSEALNRLRESTMTIGEVARGLGFSNQFYFAKFFRDMNGMTPSEFRKKILGK